MLKTSTVLMVLLVCYLGIKNDVRSNCFVTVSLNGFTYISDYVGGGGDDLKLPNGAQLPPFFNFTDSEVNAMPREARKKLVGN